MRLTQAYTATCSSTFALYHIYPSVKPSPSRPPSFRPKERGESSWWHSNARLGGGVSTPSSTRVDTLADLVSSLSLLRSPLHAHPGAAAASVAESSHRQADCSQRCAYSTAFPCAGYDAAPWGSISCKRLLCSLLIAQHVEGRYAGEMSTVESEAMPGSPSTLPPTTAGERRPWLSVRVSLQPRGL